MKPTHTLLAVLLLAGTASVASARLSTLASPTPAAPRAYLCFSGNSPEEVTKKANAAGKRGWKLVAAAQNGREAIWCFEQYQASRPHPVDQ